MRSEAPPAEAQLSKSRYVAQWDRVMRRQHVFDASLFGALLPAEAWLRVPADRVNDLLSAAPSFKPPMAR